MATTPPAPTIVATVEKVISHKLVFLLFKKYALNDSFLEKYQATPNINAR